MARVYKAVGERWAEEWSWGSKLSVVPDPMLLLKQQAGACEMGDLHCCRGKCYLVRWLNYYKDSPPTEQWRVLCRKAIREIARYIKDSGGLTGIMEDLQIWEDEEAVYYTHEDALRGEF